MPLLQPSSSRHEVEVSKPLRVNKPSTSVSSSSSSLSPQQPRPVLKPEPDLQNLEYPEPFRIKRSTSTTAPVSSPSPRPRTKKFIRPLATNEPSISTPLPPESAPYQHRRLEISPLPLRPRLTPPSKETPVDPVHRKLDAKTPCIPNLLIRRKRTYHITNEPATAALPPGTHVLITTRNTTPSTSKSSSSLSVPISPFRDQEDPPLRSNFNTGVDAILPAPLTQTLAKNKEILQIPQSIFPSPTKRRTGVKRRLTVTRKAISSLLARNLDARLHKDLDVINEKLEITAQGVTKSGEEWRNYATFVPTRSDFGVSQGTRKEALNGALEVHRYTDRRTGESEPVQVRDTTVQQIVEIRGLTLEHIRSRGRLHRTP